MHTMTDDEKNRIISRIEDTLSYLLSRKHNADIKIYFKRINSEKNDENENKS